MRRYPLALFIAVVACPAFAGDGVSLWQYQAPAQHRQPAVRTAEEPVGSPSMPQMYGYPRKVDRLFDETPLPSEAPQHLQRPLYDRPMPTLPTVQEPLYGLDPIREPAYQMPLAIEPTDDKPRWSHPRYKKPGFTTPTTPEPYYSRPNYVIKPVPLSAWQRPGYDRPMWQPPMVDEPTYEHDSYQHPRAVPPPYIATPW